MVVASASTSRSLNLFLPNHHHHHLNASSISNSSPSRSLPFFAFRTSSHSLSKLGLGLGLTALNVPPSRRQQLQVLSMRPRKADLATKESWDKILNSEVPVLVEFYASWCGPCRMVHRIIDEIAEEYAGKIKCFVLNADNDLEIAEDYDIKAVPVVLLFKNGEKRESVIGTMPKDFYVAAIERILAS